MKNKSYTGKGFPLIIVVITFLAFLMSFLDKGQGYSFYQKIVRGYDIDILIVGDSIGAGAGADTIKWTDLLKSSLETTYNIDVNIVNISMGGNTSYAGYVRTNFIDGDYDLAIICYGQNDSNENFSLYYESIISTIYKKWPKCSIISILESSQKEYTSKMIDILSLAEKYNIPVADTIKPFKNNYNNLVADSVHPNDDGQVIYAKTIEKIINELVEEGRLFDRALPANICFEAFDECEFIEVSQFERNGNVFTLQTSKTATILGIDYNIVSGDNECKIFIDGFEYSDLEIMFNYDFSQRRIMVVNDWIDNSGNLTADKVVIKNQITIIFPENESGTIQADGFNGIIISG